MKTYECVTTRDGMYARPITLADAAGLAANKGAARLIVEAPDSFQARQIAAGYNAAANAGEAYQRFTVTFRGPGAAVPVVSRLQVSQ